MGALGDDEMISCGYKKVRQVLHPDGNGNALSVHA
jgi:hypothetical protein